MGDDNLVLLVVALLWRLVTSLVDGAVLVVLVLAGLVVVAGLIAWAGRALPTGYRADGTHPGDMEKTGVADPAETTEDDRG